MAAHHLGDGRRVGRTAGRCLGNCRDFAEIVGTKDARSDDREHLGVGCVAVVEAVDRSPRYAQHLARTDSDSSPVDRKGQHAMKPVDGLLISVMAVRDGYLRSRRDIKFEHRDRTARLLTLQPESYG